MTFHSYPYVTLSTSAAAYAGILYASSVYSSQPGPEQLRMSIKSISSLHSTGTTILALYALNFLSWPIKTPFATIESKSVPRPMVLNDSENPMISGTSVFANKLMAFETGYLLYDTGALLACSYLKRDKSTLLLACQDLLKDSPVFLGHHLALVSGLLYLQTYIMAGREKGIWILVSFLLMNASNPLMHLRWALKKKHGKVSNRFDAVFAAVFAVSRFGLVSWVLQRYGKYHHMSAWRAYNSLRLECKTGVALLVGLNAVWWLGLVRKIVRSSLTSRP